MNCEKYQKLLSDYYNGEISEKNANKLKQHLETCSKCKETLEFYKILDQEIKAVSVFEPSPEYWNHYWPRLKKNIKEDLAVKHVIPFKKVNWKWSLAGIAITALLVIILTVFLHKKETGMEAVYLPFSEKYYLSLINELEEDSYLASSFKEVVLSEMGKEIKEVDYPEYLGNFNDFYNLLNELNNKEKEIFHSEIIKALKNKGVKNEIQS